MITIKCETIRLIHKNENFQLIACVPIGEYKDLAIHPTYHTITIKDPTNRLVLNKIYTVELSEIRNERYGTQYYLEAIPSLSFDNIQDITDDMEMDLLTEIMTYSQAEYIHEAYPNFIKLILSDKANEIDINKIYNVSHKRLNIYIEKINSRYNTFLLYGKTKHYKLTQQECTRLLDNLGSVDNVIAKLESSPYYCLVYLCDRYFRQADVEILQHDINHKYSKERIEYMIDYVIKGIEYEGSTYIDANRLVEHVYTIDGDVVPMLKDVAIDSDMIIYDEEKNILQRHITYTQEKSIATFLQDKIAHNETLDWDWGAYTKIKDGTLTKEQQNVLKMFCESNVLILDAPSGTGKTSSLMALIQMIEHYDMNYIMMSPTGKAASRLSEQTGRPASTIHRAVLGSALSDKDIIIIDEASMLSVDLIDMILTNEFLSPNCRMLFVGDSAQIPSIGLGRVFKDMGESGIIPKCTLTKCFRFDEGGASYVSTLTRNKQPYLTKENLVKDRFTLGINADYEFIHFNYDVDQIVDTYMSLINDGVAPQDIMVLVPYNIGGYGATQLNNLIQERINPVTTNRCMKTKHNDKVVSIQEGDLVMNTKNNYNALSYKDYKYCIEEELVPNNDFGGVAVYNGQVGKVTKYIENNGGKVLVVDIDGEEIVYTSETINNLLLAYASNPYKFQGSQCKYIINVVVPAHERAWNRQLLYTSQTRMTTKLIEIAIPEIINKAINTTGDDNRKTRLKEFLT